MKQAFIEKNERLLRFYSVALRVSGWLLFVLGICGSVLFILFPNVTVIMSMTCLAVMFLGLFGVGLDQLLRYLIDSDYKPGFILRHGIKIIYVYVILTLIVEIMKVHQLIQFVRHTDIEMQSHSHFITNYITGVVYFTVRAFILIGIAQLLKRLMPIMDEHKTLV